MVQSGMSTIIFCLCLEILVSFFNLNVPFVACNRFLGFVAPYQHQWRQYHICTCKTKTVKATRLGLK